VKKILLISFVILLLAGCGPAPTPLAVITAVPPTPGPELYIINKSTGLYEEVDIDSKTIRDLSEGTKLIPAEGKDRPDCKSFIDMGTTYTLCYMELVNTGQTGWVLIQWMDLKR
jgi:hypothetical protein